MTISIKLPGLFRDSPLGSPIYDFAIRATDEDGRGVSSYMPVRITVRDKNNNWPVPKVSGDHVTHVVMLFLLLLFRRAGQRCPKVCPMPRFR